MLYNKEFLLKLNQKKNKTIYTRITKLTFDENPIETVEGIVTQGSINIDGASAIRRSCSLTFFSQDFQYNDFQLALNTKFKLEIGILNDINSVYPNIIWFKQGIYVVTSFNSSRSANNSTISISGKDKMCLLNGEVGGSLESSIDFGAIEEENADGIWQIRKLPIIDIVRNAIHIYGKEPYHNIIINDLNQIGVELLEYRYDNPLYLYKKLNSNYYENVIIDDRKKVTVYNELDEEETSQIALSRVDDRFFLFNNDLTGKSNNFYFKFPNDENNKYQIAKIQYGDTVGYRTTDVVYPGDLVANVGEALTSILDKIKNMLVEFEYFYDIDGRFIFQQKSSSIKTLWSSINLEKPISLFSSSIDYVFNNKELITTFNNNPNLLNLRNDYSIWGEKESLSGAKIPCHLRYVIDTKPVSYTSISVDVGTKEDPGSDYEVIESYNNKHKTNIGGQISKTYSIDDYDWRELIYQMAKDYYKYNFLDNFNLRIIEANKNNNLYLNGLTGYENYYIDLEGFWRQLYYPSIKEEIEEINQEILNSNNQDKIDKLKLKKSTLEKEKENFYGYDEDSENLTKFKFWNKQILSAPNTLNFWFDFLDTNGELSQFNVKNIGSRPKSIKDTNIKALIYKDTPNVIFVNNMWGQGEAISGYVYIQIPDDYQNMFSISAQGKSAKDKLDELLNQHSCSIETATINCLPIYDLEPNSILEINDEESGISGLYSANKITLPLSYNGTMTITANKIYNPVI